MAVPTEVVVHPLVLLSITDHYNRVARDTSKRVVGVLLGTSFKGRVDITNSFAVPYDEDSKKSSIWYLDHNYLDELYYMFKKINVKETIVGFYSTGPKIRAADLQIDALFRSRKYCANPALVIVDIRTEVEGMPTQAYVSEETVVEGKHTERAYKHVPCEIGAFEAEEVGVEHLLRDINDPSVSTLAAELKRKVSSLRGLAARLGEMKSYLADVAEGRLPPSNEILYNMQKIINLLPNIAVEKLVKSMLVATNDMHLAMYLSALVRSIVALHDLVNNKIKYRDEEAKGDMPDEEEEKKEAETEKKGKDKKAAAGGGGGGSGKKAE